MKKKYYSVDEATRHAREYVRTHPSWALICDIEDYDGLHVQYDELGPKSKAYWKSQEFYDDQAAKKCKVDKAYMSGAGELFYDILSVPQGHNSMMMFKVGIKGVYRDMVKKKDLAEA